MRAVGAEHVGQLVRVADDGGRAAGDDDAGELGRQQLGGLDMHVRVDQAGDDEAAAGVHALAALVAADAGDPAAGDRHVAVEPLAREGAEHPPALDHEVRGGVAAGDGEQARAVAAHAASLASVRPARARRARGRPDRCARRDGG